MFISDELHTSFQGVLLIYWWKDKLLKRETSSGQNHGTVLERVVSLAEERGGKKKLSWEGNIKQECTSREREFSQLKELAQG